MVSPSGIITTVAGNGDVLFSGDGGPATAAGLNYPADIALDAAGNLYIADSYNLLLRRVSAPGIITTFAGTGEYNLSPDGGLATNATLAAPLGVATDAAGNLYISDNGLNTVSEVSPSGIMTTVAGSRSQGFSGDGGPATAPTLFLPYGIAVDGGGNLYIADFFNNRVRRVSASASLPLSQATGTPIFRAMAGRRSALLCLAQAALQWMGPATFTSWTRVTTGFAKSRRRESSPLLAGSDSQALGDGGPATAASLNAPGSVAVDEQGNLYITDVNNNRIRKVSTSGIITTVAGNGRLGFSGDGRAATAAALANPFGVAVDRAGNLYIADSYNNRVRKVSTTGIITTVGGDGTSAFYGDGGPATAASLAQPTAIALDSQNWLAVDAAGTPTFVNSSLQRFRSL